MAGSTNWVCDVSASRLNGQQVKYQAKRFGKAMTVSVNSLSPPQCATASFTSFLKIAASLPGPPLRTCPPWSPASHSAGRRRRVTEAVTST